MLKVKLSVEKVIQVLSEGSVIPGAKVIKGLPEGVRFRGVSLDESNEQVIELIFDDGEPSEYNVTEVVFERLTQEQEKRLEALPQDASLDEVTEAVED